MLLLERMKFIHAADIHLDSPMLGLERYEGAPVEMLRGATRRALERLVLLALEEQVAFVLIAGDLYDGDWKDYRTGLFFAKQMSRLQEAGIEVFIIAGNHDAASQLSKSLRLPENVRVLSEKAPETILREAWSVALHGQSFTARKVTDDLSRTYPSAVRGYFNIGLLHTSATGREGHETYAPCTVEGLRAKGYDYWALGHVHEREILHQSPWIVFPGNLQGRHIREPGPRGCTLVTVQDGAVAKVEARATDIVRWGWCEVEAAGARDGQDIMELVRAALQRQRAGAEGLLLAVRVRISGPCEAHPELCADFEKWEAEVHAAANELEQVWIEKVRWETCHQHDLAEVLERDDPLARLVRSIHSLGSGEALPDELVRELSDLREKLPSEMLPAGELPMLATAERRHACLEEVRQLLLPRLLAMPGAP